MTEKYITNIQERVVDLLHSISSDLGAASKERCSEVARLVGCWILDDHPDFEISILRGEFENGLAHDVLTEKQSDSFTIVDPTVWQFFPKDDTIVLGTFSTMPEAELFLSRRYGGIWHVSEKMKTCTTEYSAELLEIIVKS